MIVTAVAAIAVIRVEPRLAFRYILCRHPCESGNARAMGHSSSPQDPLHGRPALADRPWDRGVSGTTFVIESAIFQSASERLTGNELSDFGCLWQHDCVNHEHNMWMWTEITRPRYE